MAKAVLKRKEIGPVRKPANGRAKLAVVLSPEQRQAHARAQLALGRTAPSAHDADAWALAVAQAACPHIKGDTIHEVDWPALADAIRPLIGDATIKDALRLHKYLVVAAGTLYAEDDDHPLRHGLDFSYYCLGYFILTASAATWDDLEARLCFMRGEMDDKSMEEDEAAAGLLRAEVDISVLRRADAGGRHPCADEPTMFSQWAYRHPVRD